MRLRLLPVWIKTKSRLQTRATRFFISNHSHERQDPSSLATQTNMNCTREIDRYVKREKEGEQNWEIKSRAFLLWVATRFRNVSRMCVKRYQIIKIYSEYKRGEHLGALMYRAKTETPMTTGNNNKSPRTIYKLRDDSRYILRLQSLAYVIRAWTLYIYIYIFFYIKYYKTWISERNQTKASLNEE